MVGTPIWRPPPFMVIAGSAATGIAADRWCHCPLLVSVPVTLAACIGWLLLRTRRGPWSVFCLLIGVGALMACRHHLHWNVYRADEAGLFLTETPCPVCIELTVESCPLLVPPPPNDCLQPVAQGPTTRFDGQVQRVRDGRHWRPISGGVAVKVEGQLTGIHAGDQVIAWGQLHRPASPRNPGQRDLAEFFRGQRQLCQLKIDYPDCVQRLTGLSTNSPYPYLQRIRSECLTALWRSIGSDRRGLAAALLMGAREQLEPDQTDAFLLTGTVHILAISGFHVGILASAFYWAARSSLVPERLALGGVMIITLLYAAITDAGAPVERAAIMIWVICGAWLLRRSLPAFNSLALAAFIVFLLNPSELWRPGCQLSFAAVAVLFWGSRHCFLSSRVSDPLDQLVLQSRPVWRRIMRTIGYGLAQLLLTSLIVWLITVPLAMHSFHLVSPVAPLLNVLLWIPTTVSLLAGFAVLLFTPACPMLGQLMGKICDVGLWSMQIIVDSAVGWPLSHYWVAGPGLIWTAVFYVAVIGAIGCRSRPPALRWCVAGYLFWIASPLAMGMITRMCHTLRSDAPLTCRFLSVGHGTCALLQLPSGHHILYDAGSMAPPRYTADMVARALWHVGVRRLDGIIISHADADHYNLVPRLLQRFSVGQIWISHFMFDQPTPALDALRTSIEGQGIPLRVLAQGDRLLADPDVGLSILHPLTSLASGSDNARSLVLKISYAGKTLLLPGDLESPGLEQFMSRPREKLDVVMAPHHGSMQSDVQAFADWCDPDLIVISGQRNERAEPLMRGLQQQGIGTFHTAHDGAVKVELRADAVAVTSWRTRPETTK